jgi:hypothetical protein
MDLRTARFLKRKSQWELQAATGVPQSRISLIERGLIKARPDERLRLSRELGFEEFEIEWINER